jgi:hypothetical protein
VSFASQTQKKDDSILDKDTQRVYLALMQRQTDTKRAASHQTETPHMTNIEELNTEIRRLRRSVERSNQKLVRANEAARLLGMSPAQFRKTRPLPGVDVPGQAHPMYSVRAIDELIEQWTNERTA